MLQHCARYEHISAAQGQNQVPPQFVDPRHHPEYQTLNTFHKARVISEHRSMVVEFIRAPMNDAALTHMEDILEMVKGAVKYYFDEHLNHNADEFENNADLLHEFHEDYDTALFWCTLERTINACVEEFAVKSFYKHGICSICRDIICYGWESFQVSEVEDETHLAALVSGSFLVTSMDEFYNGSWPFE